MCSSTHMCMHGLRWMYHQRRLHQKAGKLSSSTYNRVHRHVVCRCEEHVRRGRHLQACKVKLSGQKHARQHFFVGGCAQTKLAALVVRGMWELVAAFPAAVESHSSAAFITKLVACVITTDG